MSNLLSNFVAGRWQAGSGPGTKLIDPVLGTELARVDATGLDLSAAFAAFAAASALGSIPHISQGLRRCSAKPPPPQPISNTRS